MSLLRSLQRARQQSHGHYGLPTRSNRAADQPDTNKEVAAGRTCALSGAPTQHAACSAAPQTGEGATAAGWRVSIEAHSPLTAGWSAALRGLCSVAARPAEAAAVPNMAESGSVTGLAAPVGEAPVPGASAVSARQSDVSAAAGGSAGQTQTAFHAGAAIPITPWLPRPEMTYIRTVPATAPASAAAASGVHAADIGSSAEASTEPLTAKAAFYRMRAALRSGDPSRALELFSPDAEASHLSLLAMTCCTQLGRIDTVLRR